MSIRSFISFDLNDDAVVENLIKIQTTLYETGAALKLVKPENIHITLRFLGDVQDSLINQLYLEMETVRFTPFPLEIRGVGVFPSLRFPKVVWVGIEKGAKQVKAVFDQLEPKLRNLGFKPDKKGFRPHVTIARVKGGRNKKELSEAITKLGNFEVGEVNFDCLRLKGSVLTPQGPIYSTLKEVCPGRAGEGKSPQ